LLPSAEERGRKQERAVSSLVLNGMDGATTFEGANVPAGEAEVQNVMGPGVALGIAHVGASGAGGRDTGGAASQAAVRDAGKAEVANAGRAGMSGARTGVGGARASVAGVASAIKASMSGAG
jgi:hypothetical protein